MRAGWQTVGRWDGGWLGGVPRPKTMTMTMMMPELSALQITGVGGGEWGVGSGIPKA